MKYEYFNPNPENRSVGDCVIRAICKAFEFDWYRAYCEICLQGFMMCDIPSSDNVWGAYLKKNGFKRINALALVLNDYANTDIRNRHCFAIVGCFDFFSVINLED